MLRRQFDDKTHKIVNSLGEFPQTTRDFAKEQGLPLVDLNARAEEFFNILGPDGTLKAFCWHPDGMYEGRTARMDNTHFNPYGAYELAKIVAREIKNGKLGLAAWWFGGSTGGTQNTDPAKFPDSLNYNPMRIEK